jgi:Rieske Fe-S protein
LGNVISGPPPKPLPHYGIKVVDNEIKLSEA